MSTLDWVTRMSIRVLHVFGGGVRSGIETHILTLAKGLKGADVELLLAPLNHGIFCDEARPYVSEIILSDKKFRGDLGFVKRLSRRIAKAGVDIVHTHSFDGNFYGSRAARSAGRIQVVNTVHTFEIDAMIDMYKSRLIRSVVCRQNLRLLRAASRLIAVCAPIKENLVDRGIDEAKIKVVPNGLDPADYPIPSSASESARKELGLPDDRPVVGTIGRISRVKNMDVFLRAARRVLDRGIRAKFVIIGDGPLRGQIEGLASELKLDDDVIFTGFQADAHRFLPLMDLFVLCSQTEGLSYTLLEAMAMVRPIVATAVGGNTDIVSDGETGLLVPAGDVESTAGSIIRLLTDGHEAERFGLAGREALETRFHAKTMAEKTLDVYKELARNGK